MSEQNQAKSHIKKLYFGILTASNIIINPILHIYLKIDSNIINAISPMLSIIIAYSLILIFKNIPSVEDIDTNKRLKNIQKAMGDNLLSDDAKKILQDRYDKIILKNLE